MPESIIILVGFTMAAVNSLQSMKEKYRILIIEEPDVIRKRNIDNLIVDKDIVYDLLPYEYQHAYAADALYAQLKTLNIISVVPAIEYATCCAARLAERFNLDGAGYGASLILRNKFNLREVTKAFGINNPHSKIITTYEQAEDFFQSTQGSVIFKPSNRQGSLGTVIVHDKNELLHAWQLSQTRDEGVMVPDRDFVSETLIEEFIVGNEYSVEALIKDEEFIFTNVTQKILFDGQRPVEKGHIIPAMISSELQSKLVMQTKILVNAVGFNTGIVHCEWIHNEKGFYLVECAGRFPGDGIVELIERAYDYDLVSNYHRLMRRQPIALPPTEPNRYMMVHFYGGEKGVVKDVIVNEELISQLGIFNFSLSVKKGDSTVKPESSWHRLGSAMLSATNISVLQEKINQLDDTVAILYGDA